ncbi:phytanoyl-CoA dioxygenase [Gilvibacter sediminis]|uniref:phytanoyl-CoA dioxygenase n=1 Tax=Gilvibacter sediminis TaxID=379071 RepID=UPI0023505DBF|nr:phytanoyl-CoA dioxygenase [Gilvibacter sediminis]MDC7997937.1 phytanoyl-CoA dioxygenase [Gilvibacter sediminis]
MTDQQSNKETLKTAVLSILEDPQNDQNLHGRLMQIHGLFSELTQVSGMDQEMEMMAAVPSAYGKALGINHAAQCLLDLRRTSKFLQGMQQAIALAKTRVSGRPVKVFYAGCGPYAPFMTLLTAIYSSEELSFSILEINERSLEAAKKLIQALELEEYLIDAYLADAVTFKVPEADQYDILFSETLDALLYRECYVPILHNMLPQFNDDIILIPENVSLELSLIKPAAAGSEDREELHKKTIVNVSDLLGQIPQGDSLPSVFKEVPVSLASMDDFESLIIDTRVKIHEDIVLERGESSLSLPLEMRLEKPFPDSTITFNYQLEPQIELKYTLEPLGS